MIQLFTRISVACLLLTADLALAETNPLKLFELGQIEQARSAFRKQIEQAAKEEIKDSSGKH